MCCQNDTTSGNSLNFNHLGTVEGPALVRERMPPDFPRFFDF